MPSLPALLLAVAFAWAALSKAARPRAWKAALDGYGLARPVRRTTLFAVPAAEAAAAALLLLGGDATRAGAALSVALLSAFSLAVLRARRLRGDRLPCGCFGGSGRRDYRLMLVRNSVLAAVAAAALSTRHELDAPGAGEAVPAILAGLGIALIAWLGVALARVSR